MFVIKSINDEQELAHCESQAEVLEKASALWISTGGRIKIIDTALREFSLDEFKAAVTPKMPSAPRIEEEGLHGEPRQNPDKPDIDLPGG